MKRAKGPSNLHSPFSAPGRDSPPDVKFIEGVRFTAEAEAACLRVDAAMYERVGERTISTISAGKEWAAGVGTRTSLGDIILEGQADH